MFRLRSHTIGGRAFEIIRPWRCNTTTLRYRIGGLSGFLSHRWATAPNVLTSSSTAGYGAFRPHPRADSVNPRSLHPARSSRRPPLPGHPRSPHADLILAGMAARVPRLWGTFPTSMGRDSGRFGGGGFLGGPSRPDPSLWGWSQWQGKIIAISAPGRAPRVGERVAG